MSRVKEGVCRIEDAQRRQGQQITDIANAIDVLRRCLPITATPTVIPVVPIPETNIMTSTKPDEVDGEDKGNHQTDPIAEDSPLVDGADENVKVGIDVSGTVTYRENEDMQVKDNPPVPEVMEPAEEYSECKGNSVPEMMSQVPPLPPVAESKEGNENVEDEGDKEMTPPVAAAADPMDEDKGCEGKGEPEMNPPVPPVEGDPEKLVNPQVASTGDQQEDDVEGGYEAHVSENRKLCEKEKTVEKAGTSEVEGKCEGEGNCQGTGLGEAA